MLVGFYSDLKLSVAAFDHDNSTSLQESSVYSVAHWNYQYYDEMDSNFALATTLFTS